MLLTLIGYRGSGKTTVARLLAAQFRVDWWDTDVEIEQRAGMSIKQIFEELGEEGFRALEEQVIAELAAKGPGVLAVGGGAVLRAANRMAIARGKVVWLTAEPQSILSRVLQDPQTQARRPNLTKLGGLSEIERLLAAREPLYSQCADHRVSTDAKTPEQIAAEIVCLLPEFPASAG